MNEQYHELENIANLLNQGYFIEDIIHICKTILKSKRLDSLYTYLESGIALEEAILKCDFDKTFKEYFSFFIKKNEISEAIIQSIKICKVKDGLVQTLKKELTYPIFLIVFLLGFSIFVVFGLLPQVKMMFQEFQTTQSLLQQIVFSLFSYLPLLVVFILMVLIGMGILCIYTIKKQRLDILDQWLIKIPGISHCIKKYYSLKFALYYNELLKSGYDSTEIITVLNTQMEDSDIKMIVYELYIVILKGESFEEVVGKFEYFEELFIKYFQLLMKSIQEEKSLDNYILISITTIQSKISKYIKVIVPFIYGFVACFVVMVYISIILPMMDVVSVM